MNNVVEAGEYPFRDGTIAVTFVEAAIWKDDPDARFELMRKHPIQKTTQYVLGRQIGEKLAASETEAELFYQSSNGDSWSIAPDPVSGAPAVMHQPNPQSGGQVSYSSFDKFLAEGANGPEHQALRRLMETSARMANILIGYDVHFPKDEAYDELAQAIQALGSWWHHLETIWIVKTVYTPKEIRNRLKHLIGREDQLLVVDISGDIAEWAGLNDVGSKWLKNNIRAT